MLPAATSWEDELCPAYEDASWSYSELYLYRKSRASSSRGSATTSLRQKSLEVWKQHFVLARNKKLTPSSWYLGERRLAPKPLLEDYASKNSSVMIQWGLIILTEVSGDQSDCEQSVTPPKG